MQRFPELQQGFPGTFGLYNLERVAVMDHTPIPRFFTIPSVVQSHSQTSKLQPSRKSVISLESGNEINTTSRHITLMFLTVSDGEQPLKGS